MATNCVCYSTGNNVTFKFGMKKTSIFLNLNLLPTCFRREITDLTMFLKSLRNKTNLDLDTHIEFSNRDLGPRTRSLDHQTRIKLKKTRLDSTSSFFHYRICRIWNRLPTDIRIALKNTHSPLVIKQHLIPYFRQRLANDFDPNNQCTWISWCGCGRCLP